MVSMKPLRWARMASGASSWRKCPASGSSTFHSSFTKRSNPQNTSRNCEARKSFQQPNHIYYAITLKPKLGNAFFHCPNDSISHIFKTTKKQSQTTLIRAYTDNVPQTFPHFPMPRIFPYIHVYGQKTGELHHKQN